MYWRQAIASAFLAAGAGYIVYTQRGNPLVSAGVVIAVYVSLRVFIATLFRTRYWLDRGGHQSQSRSCSNCGQYIRRQSGDWILRCKQCGWTVSYPFVRWLTHSVPVVQFRRSLGLSRLGVLALSLIVVVSAPTVGGLGLGSSLDLGDQFSEPTDRDGDGLVNRVESSRETNGGYPLPQADEDHKDIYVRVYVGNGIQPLTTAEQADLREIWASMPVTNPDGKEGIDLHITQVQLSQSITADLDNEGLRDLETQIYKQRVPEVAQCSVYAVILVNVAGDPVISGRGAAPGYVAIVDGHETQRYSTEYTIRTTTITHELLHNIVGKFEDGSIHTSGGWLTGNPGTHGTQFYLSNKTAARLSNRGFAESDYFEEEVCR